MSTCINDIFIWTAKFCSSYRIEGMLCRFLQHSKGEILKPILSVHSILNIFFLIKTINKTKQNTSVLFYILLLEDFRDRLWKSKAGAKLRLMKQNTMENRKVLFVHL